MEGDPNHILIIGAGVFGLSTAIALGKRYPDIKVTVVDRFEPPVPDGTSVDTNRCIRFDYPSKLYFELAREAVDMIKRDPEVSKFFHQNGMSFIYDGIPGTEWDEKWKKRFENAKIANKSDPSKVLYTPTASDVFQNVHGPNKLPLGQKELGKEPEWNKGYTNLSCGFIDAKASIEVYYKRARSFTNVSFVFKEVEAVKYKPNSSISEGVTLVDGTDIKSDLVIVSAGAWSSKLVPLNGVTKTHSIAVAWLKVTKEEEMQWKNMPITSNMSAGINIFPPYKGEVKCLRRFNGYKNTTCVDNPDPMAQNKINISYPRTMMTNKSDWIPLDAEVILRQNLKEMMPPLHNRPFDRTKLCWMTDTITEDFLIDYHPSLKNVMMATGGSGHAWKFVPLIGDKIIDFLEGNLTLDFKEAWSWKSKKDTRNDRWTEGESQELMPLIRKNPGSHM